MPLILNIDTSTQHGSTCIARDGNCMALLQNPEQKDHAAWIHPAIQELLKHANCTLSDLQAVAVTAGPGSYTGLRVAMATAKGLCYALRIPMITENTLRVMAFVSVEYRSAIHHLNEALHCPMIDARRMEVFTALYNSSLVEIMQPAALVLTPDSFIKELETNTIIFSGDGSKKFRVLMNHPHAIFEDFQFNATHLAVLSNMKFLNSEFVEVAYAEPLYLKEFYTVPKK
jgi:tRNA threonylcarbamoyladenosine biosynthesis protein TsaB